LLTLIVDQGPLAFNGNSKGTIGKLTTDGILIIELVSAVLLVIFPVCPRLLSPQEYNCPSVDLTANDVMRPA
jgi:hypothetical protein